jgi:hypothetical protein
MAINKQNTKVYASFLSDVAENPCRNAPIPG